MVDCEVILEVDYREDERHEFAQRQYQSHCQRSAFRRQDEYRTDAHVSNTAVKEMIDAPITLYMY